MRAIHRVWERIGALLCLGLLFCSACAGPATPAASPTAATATLPAPTAAGPAASPLLPTAPGPSPSVVPPTPTTVTAAVDWVAAIQAGSLFVVLFDETSDNFDDSRYTGDWQTDPLGTLQGGAAYQVRFSPADGWVTSGYNQGAGETITAAHPATCAVPAERQLCLWGGRFTFDEQGQVFYPDYGLVGHLQTSPQPDITPAPVVAVAVEIETALWDYTRLRKEAEETLNPALLAQVCVDPYLTWKTERIEENIRDGSHWATPAAQLTVISFTQPASDTAVVWIDKVETKLFYPQGSSVPDDEVCTGPIQSYRDCAYQIEYRLVRRDGRWYVSEAQSIGDCVGQCRVLQAVFPPAAVPPQGWPALPADLYFLRDGRLWRWLASGAGLQDVTLPVGGAAVQNYALSPDGRHVAYATASGDLYALEVATGELVWPAGAATPPAVRDYSLLASGRLLYLTPADQLYVVDLATGAYVLPPAGEEATVVARYTLAGDGRFLAYETTAGQLYAADLAAGVLSWVPTGDPVAEFALAPDGHTALYLTRHQVISVEYGQPEVYSGTLFAAPVGTAGPPVALGDCAAGVRLNFESFSETVGCRGFMLSPDGTQAAYQDWRGIWVAAVPAGGPPRLLLAEQPQGGCGYHLDGWTPDSQGLLLGMGCYMECWGTLLLVVQTGAVAEIGWCCVCCCSYEVAPAPEGVWGDLTLYRISSAGTIETIPRITLTGELGLWPTELHPLPGGRLAFVHQRCALTQEELDNPDPEPGIYIREADRTVRQVAPLPRFPWLEGEESYEVTEGNYEGSVSWSVDAAAFLYLDRAGGAMLLGRIDGSALWDVRQVLVGATAFRWAPQP